MSVTSIEETSGSPLNGYTGEPVDYSSLTFEATYEDGTTGSVTPTSCTPSVWGEPGTETITFNFADTDVTCDVEGESIAPTPTLTSLTYTGTLTNDQFVGSAPDLTGLTFTAHYSDSTLDQEVTPTSVLPATYAEAGSATVTAAYTDEYGTASVEISVTVVAAALTLTSISISGTPTNEQQVGNPIDWTGCTFTYGLSNGTSIVLSGNEGVYNSTDEAIISSEEGDGLEEGEGRPVWVDLSETPVTVRPLTYYWTSKGYEVADPAPSTSIQVTVQAPL